MKCSKNLAEVLEIDKDFRIKDVEQKEDNTVIVSVERKKKDYSRACGSRKLTVHETAQRPVLRLHNRTGNTKKVYISFYRPGYRCLNRGNKFMDHGFGIDEHSFSGKQMVIRAVQLSAAIPLIILKRDCRAELKRFFHGIPWWIKKRIVEAAMDLRSRNKKVIEEELPDTDIAADRFHVVRDSNMRFDERILIQQEISSQGKKRRMKIPKLIFMKRWSKPSKTQRMKVNYYLNKYQYLRAWYEYKEKVAAIYEQENRDSAGKYLDKLNEKMKDQEDADFHKWARMLSRWRERILNYYNNRTTTAMVEGYHNPIKLLKRTSFGFKDVEKR